jgi:hypothetical protein
LRIDISKLFDFTFSQFHEYIFTSSVIFSK